MHRSLFKLKNMLSIVAAFVFAAISSSAFAAVSNENIYETVLDRYQAVASTWAAVITSHASWLFWTLALISMVWTFGMMALRKADLQEFFAEFVKFTIFVGFYWWLLTNGPNFADSIIKSLRQIGGQATGLGAKLTPSTVADIGFDVFFSTIDKASMRSPLISFVGILLGAGVLLLLALVAVNMLILLVSSWILLYGGVFFLGFGGSRWTSDMAINYYKTVLGVAASLFAMVLIIGVATSIMDQYYQAMGADIQLKELAVVMIVAFIMAMLVKSVPPLISGIITGASIGQGGAMGFGAGALVGGAAMGAAAVATAGAAIAAGAAGAAGGAQALMAAFSKASAAASESGGGDMLADAMSGGGDASGGGSSLAAAMGGGGSGGGGSDGGGSGGGGFDGGGSGGGGSDGGGSGGGGFDGGGSGGGGSDGGGSDGGGSDGGGSATPASQSGSNTKGSDAPASSTPKTGLAKAGAIAAGTVGNLAQGSWDVAKAKAGSMREAAMDRIGETTGGKIAAAIKGEGATNSGSNQNNDSDKSTGSGLGAAVQAAANSLDEAGGAGSTATAFSENHLAAGKSKATSPSSEVAAFVNKTNS